MNKPQGGALLGMAFLCGLAVMILEIGGARALAPYFGSSLQVWTSQITATLLFLAIGYALGARLAGRGPWMLPLALLAAGFWLCLYAIFRQLVLESAVASLGVVAGSFAGSSLLFGLPLMGLGASSPLVVELFPSQSSGAAAGRVFFVGTLGSLAGGWITALVLIPHFSLRWSLLGTGLALVLLGCFWAWRGRVLKTGKAAVLTLLAAGILFSSQKGVGTVDSHGSLVPLYSRQTSVGLLQVLDIPPSRRCLLLDGVMQGGISKLSGHSFLAFSDYLDHLALLYHPHAKSALLLGLGCGVLADELAARGLDVTVAELEPRISEVARTYFNLNPGIHVVSMDGRAFLRSTSNQYDLVFLDTFAGEVVPFYLTTQEAARQMRDHLNPGGKLLINTVTRLNGQSAGLARLESVFSRAFRHALVFVEPGGDAGSSLVNGIVLAGDGELKAEGKGLDRPVEEGNLEKCRSMAATARPAKDSGLVNLDEQSDLDYADSGLRLEWRKILMDDLGAKILED